MQPEQRAIDLPNGRIELLVGGEGPTVTVLPRDTGHGGWGRFHDLLAARYRVHAPGLPGFDGSERPDWLRNVIDLSALVGFLLDATGTAPGPLVGLGFGGWVAAEIAARSPQRVTRLVLHSPVGLKPDEGEIADQFLFGTTAYVQMGFADESLYGKLYGADQSARLDVWENNREMTTRIAWKPHMYDPALGYLLRNVRIPAAVIWSRGDRIVPKSCAAAYCAALAVSSYDEVAGGHAADIEAPEALAGVVLARLAG